jgi:peptidoglycan-N-acetylmuramic acid deacetylase PdaC-like protein
MKRIATAFASLALTIAPALAADYDTTEKSPLCEGHLRVPAAAMAIPALKDRILALHKTDLDEAKADAKDDKEGNPSFHPYTIYTIWRVTFENATVLSLSGDTDADTGGAHPNQGFQTIVWDKKAGQAVPIEALFAPDQVKAALTAIADAASKVWTKTYTQRSGQPPGKDTDLAETGIGADPERLKTYALIYAKGQTAANGIVLLYGAGQAWPHVLGDFRLAIPVAVFAKYLRPQWKDVFIAG